MTSRFLALLFMLLLSPLFLIIGMAILLSEGLPIFFKQRRIGKNNQEFTLYKFRTMKKNTPHLPTHLLENPEQHLLKVGIFLRKLSLDELPNLINILRGEMNFVGPRPALFNQEDLIELRTKENVHTIKPGLTGWAQVNGRDELPLHLKVEYDSYYFKNKSLLLDLKILFRTIFKSLSGDGIVH